MTSLEGGGTENFLYQILAHSPAGYDHQVFYLKKDGVIGERLRRHQITVRPAGSLLRLYRTFRTDKPDLLHTCLYSAHQIGRVLGRLARVPVIITSQRSIDIWQKPWQRWIDRVTLPGCDVVIANSEAAASVIRQRRGSREYPHLQVIPNGVDTQRFVPGNRTAVRQRYGVPPEAVVGGSLMRLHSEKGADFIPSFAEKLLNELPNLHLVVGGVGPMAEDIQEQMDKTSYVNRVHLIGWEDDTPAFLSACDFFWSLSREESFPQTLVEASVFGLPWVAPNVGGVIELRDAGAAGHVFPRLDIAEAALQAAQLVKDLPTLAPHAREVSAKIRSDYSLEKMIRSVYEVFDASMQHRLK